MAKRKILLAEDDEDDQLLFQEFLKNRNDIKILPVAENGEVLIDLLEGMNGDDDFPDLIILDQNMPKRNGLQTLRFLKETKRYLEIPVIIYSTYTDENLIKEGTNAGACLVLTKPLSKEGYNEMIEKMIRSCVSD